MDRAGAKHGGGGRRRGRGDSEEDEVSAAAGGAVLGSEAEIREANSSEGDKGFIRSCNSRGDGNKVSRSELKQQRSGQLWLRLHR
ncbi:hypothetical protein OsJ_25092 [Oryza sativa Japonica Group]|uniref:Uncharacterized protein n=2 Tax=Oryza TaxID=4527 RepID=A3BM39_ORYSJ|nr:hypothetical protein OsJ_25092 [Oryza sativa Japonica Group]BAC21306.1 hypothetical protein [Oryza sativa Japonica Group]BAD31865.1 hypothetical protein [Oryza sativa Japonica Group]